MPVSDPGNARRRRTFLALACAICTLSCATGAAWAADAYPSKAIRLIVPFAPGGTTDAIARIIADKCGTLLGQSVIVENRAGAGGNVGTDIVARAAPDGYTLAMVGNSFTVNPALYRSMPYRQQDLAPVALAGSVPFVLDASLNSPFKTLPALLAYAKANPGKVTYASGGNGTIGHLGAYWLSSLAKVDMLHIPYKGGSAAMTDLVAGRVDIFLDTMVTSSAFIKAGKIRPLFVSTRKRLDSLPDVPTAAEVGFPELTFSAWVGMVAPAKTPQKILERLNAAVNQALATADVQRKLAAIGSQPFALSLAETQKYFQEETARWGAVVKSSGARVD